MSSIHVMLADDLAKLEELRQAYDNRAIDNAFHKDQPGKEVKYLAARECVQLADQLIEAHLALIKAYGEHRR